jgi:hypothetical protein
MKVFLSSVISGFGPYRAAATDAIHTLGHEIIRAEDFPASSLTPQQACLAGVRESDVVVVLLGERYGQPQASGKSATHEEFEEAAQSKPVLVFEQLGLKRDDLMQAFVTEVQDWVHGSLSATFSRPDDLRVAVTRSLADHAVREQRGLVDDDDVVARSLNLLPAQQRSGPDTLTVVVAGGPYQQVLRPATIEDLSFIQSLKQLAMFGPNAILDSELGAKHSFQGDVLRVGNDQGHLLLDPAGTIAVILPARRPNVRAGGITLLESIIEEDIQERITGMIRFAAQLLDTVDPTNRLTAVAPVAGLAGSLLAWRTRAEAEASPNSMSIGWGQNLGSAAAQLTPPVRSRSQLLQRTDELAEDLTVLLRRKVKG